MNTKYLGMISLDENADAGDGDANANADLAKEVADLVGELKASRADAKPDDKPVVEEPVKKPTLNIKDLTEKLKGDNPIEAVQEVIGEYHQKVIEPERRAMYRKAADDERRRVAADPILGPEYKIYKDRIDTYIKDNRVTDDALSAPGNIERLLRLQQVEDTDFSTRKLKEKEDSIKNKRRNLPHLESGAGDSRGTGDDGSVTFSDEELHIQGEMGLTSEDDQKALKDQKRRIHRVETDPELRKRAIEDGGIPI